MIIYFPYWEVGKMMGFMMIAFSISMFLSQKNPVDYWELFDLTEERMKV